MPTASKDLDKRERIVKRIARELRDGFYVNLGIGMPTLIANHVPAGIEVMLQSRERDAGHRALSGRGAGGSGSDQCRKRDGQRDAGHVLFLERAIRLP